MRAGAWVSRRRSTSASSRSIARAARASRRTRVISSRCSRCCRDHRERTIHMSARLPYVEDPPPEIAPVYEEMKKATGRVLNITRMMAHHPPKVALFQAWYRTTREGPLELTLTHLAYEKTSPSI